MSAATATPAPAVRSRSGSEKRQRGRKIGVSVDAEELARIEEKASASGLSLSSFLRASALGSTGPRAKRRPPVNAELLAYAVAQLNRTGSNLNQIAKTLNAGRAVGAEDALTALAETRAAVAKIREAVGRKDRP